MEWIKMTDKSPEAGKVVDTKIDDEQGVRNEQPLFRSVDGLWWVPDFSVYVYYTPTHWKPKQQ